MAQAVKRPLSQSDSTIEHPLPTKKIRIQAIAKPSTGNKTLQLAVQLEIKNNSKEVLETLIKIADELYLTESDLPEVHKAMDRLIFLFRHVVALADTTIRVKIVDIFAEFAVIHNAELVQKLIEETIALLKQEKSQKVKAQGLFCLHKMGVPNLKLLPCHLIAKLAGYAQKSLLSESYRTQKYALLVLSAFVPLAEAKSVIETIASYADSPDCSVRAQALHSILCLDQRGFALSPNIYLRAVDAMRDDYECVRREALQLAFEISLKHPDHMITLKQSEDEEEMRLIDAAFSQVCGALCDLSIQIRTQAAEHLGSMTQVSSEFLIQTLHKRLMSNLRRKKSAHERGAQLIASGEWSSGKRWGDDAPQEELDETSITLVANGACGALVHGLEDEFLEVRTATVDSMCKLALSNPDFAVMCLDFLVDMFNDEIEDVRLKSIYSLTAISKHIVLREDQLEMMLSSLEDYSTEVREGLHLMLGACRVSTQACLLMVVQKLLDVLAKYPQDKMSAFECMRKIGQKHADICMGVVSHLLQDHPLFDSAERDVEDPAYLCILILLYNAAEHAPPIVSLFPGVTLKHYAYLRDAMPQLVPDLPIEGASKHYAIDKVLGGEASRQYLQTLLQSVEKIFTLHSESRLSLLYTAQKNFERLGEIDEELFGTASFLRTYLAAQIEIEQVQNHNDSPHRRTPLEDSLARLVRNCLKLQHIYTGLTNADMLLVKQICLRASALHLVFIVRDSKQSALGPCQMLLSTANDLSNFLDKLEEEQEADAANNQICKSDNADSFKPLEADDFTNSLLEKLASISDPKPGRVFREILPLVETAKPIAAPNTNINIRMCTANVIEPNQQCWQDNIIKVTAGLIAALPFVADIDNLRETQKQDMRIKIKYPDQYVHTVVPKLTDFRKIMTDEGEHATRIRLRTTILLSHSVWTEASQVELTLCLAVRPGTDLELCKPAKILFAPKPVRRGI